MFGYIRVLDSDKVKLLACSGDDFFIDPSRDAAVGPIATEWIAQSDDEDGLAYLSRCRKAAAAYGVVCGHHGLGIRRVRDASAPVTRVWLLQGVPQHWTQDQVLAAVEGTLTTPSLLKRRQVRGSVDFFIRGAYTGTADMIALSVPIDTGTLELWLRLRRAPPRQNQASFRKCKWQNELPLQPAKKVFATETVTAEPPTLAKGVIRVCVECNHCALVYNKEAKDPVKICSSFENKRYTARIVKVLTRDRKRAFVMLNKNRPSIACFPAGGKRLRL